MNVHDGDVRQWAPGGPFYYYGMRYDRCHYEFCAQKNCSHLTDHTVLAALGRGPGRPGESCARCVLS